MNEVWSLSGFGITEGDEEVLHRIAARLHRWHLKCVGNEAVMLQRLADVMKAYPDLLAYQQTDPRGPALYIVRRRDIPDGKLLRDCYIHGVAVH